MREMSLSMTAIPRGPPPITATSVCEKLTLDLWTILALVSMVRVRQ